jgi:hypothetical protein
MLKVPRKNKIRRKMIKNPKLGYAHAFQRK